MKSKAYQFLILIAVTTALVSGVHTVHAGDKYTYKCPICKLVEVFGTPGMYKCPQDGTLMMLMGN